MIAAALHCPAIRARTPRMAVAIITAANTMRPTQYVARGMPGRELGRRARRRAPPLQFADEGRIGGIEPFLLEHAAP